MEENSGELVRNALEFYDMNREKTDNILHKVKFVKLEYSGVDNIRNTVICYNKNKKELFRSKFETLGYYVNLTKSWIWAWADPENRMNTTDLARKVLNYGLDLPVEQSFLKTEIITSRFKLNHLSQLDFHLGIASYLTKVPMIIGLKSNALISGTMFAYDHNKEEKKENYTQYFYYLLDPNI